MSYQNIVIDSNCHLSLRENYLVVKNDNYIKSLFIENINSLIINSTQVEVTTALINELINNNVLVLFCDNKKNPSSLILGLNKKYNCNHMKKQQLLWCDEIKNKVWIKIIESKFYTQGMLINKYLNKKVQLSIIEICSVDAVEGAFAKEYFKLLFGSKFTRREDNIINRNLNYGYSILISMICREITKHGLLLELGIHHHNQNNNLNFAYDLIEPFRFLIDEVVYTSITDKLEKDLLINIGNKKCNYNGKIYTICNAIEYYVSDVIRCLNNNDLKFELKVEYYE